MADAYPTPIPQGLFLNSSRILALQRQAGNQAVRDWLGSTRSRDQISVQRVVELIQHNSKDADPQELPPDEDEFDTGQMTACVTLVVLWNFNAKKQQYDNVRGYHGGGGAAHINFHALFDGVPANAGTQVLCLYGTDAEIEREHKDLAGSMARYSNWEDHKDNAESNRTGRFIVNRRGEVEKTSLGGKIVREPKKKKDRCIVC